jgi:hypothetical protein
MPSQSQRSIPQGLYEKTRNIRVPPYRLQEIGREAAKRYADGSSLTDAVISAAGSEELGPEHIRRICEFANQEAYKHEWDKGGNVRNIEFEGGPADPAVVMRELNDGARDVEDKPQERLISDYDTEPDDNGPVKLSSANIEEEIFAGYTNPAPHKEDIVDPVNELARLHHTFNGAEDHVMSKLSSLNVREQEVKDSLCHEVRKAVLDGESFAKIAYAWARSEVPRNVIVEMTKTASRHLVDTGVRTFDMIKDEFEKQAFNVKVPNPDHPLIDKMMALAKIAQAQTQLKGASTVLSERKQDVSNKLKELF